MTQVQYLEPQCSCGDMGDRNRRITWELQDQPEQKQQERDPASLGGTFKNWLLKIVLWPPHMCCNSSFWKLFWGQGHIVIALLVLLFWIWILLLTWEFKSASYRGSNSLGTGNRMRKSKPMHLWCYSGSLTCGKGKMFFILLNKTR